MVKDVGLTIVFIDRLWRSVKYEEVYLHVYESLIEACGRSDKYFRFYNAKRKHQTLNAKSDGISYLKREEKKR